MLGKALSEAGKDLTVQFHAVKRGGEAFAGIRLRLPMGEDTV